MASMKDWPWLPTNNQLKKEIKENKVAMEQYKGAKSGANNDDRKKQRTS